MYGRGKAVWKTARNTILVSNSPRKISVQGNLNKEDKLEHKELFDIHQCETNSVVMERNWIFTWLLKTTTLKWCALICKQFYLFHMEMSAYFTTSADFSVTISQFTILRSINEIGRCMYNYLRSFPTEHELGIHRMRGIPMLDLIERERKRAVRGGPIYVPSQIMSIIQLAKNRETHTLQQRWLQPTSMTLKVCCLQLARTLLLMQMENKCCGVNCVLLNWKKHMPTQFFIKPAIDRRNFRQSMCDVGLEGDRLLQCYSNFTRIHHQYLS
ncbi:hypothetical protein PR048_020140 [Dryococelus australis]|uniref:Uncharacterized protein n=1 Tax=Dryococelus australis TaxID=614101 RepID=A0ABQ9H5G3_9NEOP|nr:hypothetical protein PR048_020140 [Dryococelus australis]